MKTDTGTVRYIGALTAMRGIAAIWVMLFHIDVSLFYRDMGALVPRDASGILSKGYLWVDFFFLLSGFVICHVYAGTLSPSFKMKAVVDYAWARLARIYPLHLLCLGLVIIIALTYPLFLPNVKDGSWQTFMAWRAIPSNLLLTHAMNQHTYLSWDIVSWSIGAEAWTYVAALPLMIILPRAPLKMAGLFAALAFAALCGLVWLQPEKTLDITYNWGFFRCLFEFVIGCCLWRAVQSGAFRWLGRDVVPPVLLLVIACLFHFKTVGLMGDLIVVPLFCALLLTLIHNQGRVRKLVDAPPLQYIGRISYALYLVHGVVFMAFWFLMPTIKATWGAPSAAGRLAYAAAFIVIVFAVSHAVHSGFEVPVRRWLLARRGERIHAI